MNIIHDMPSLLDSRQLNMFVTLAKTGSFTRAADRLHLSQSAVSHAMKSLEGDVGCLLLDRAGKKVTLTQAGEQLLKRAESILRQMDEARQELKGLSRWGRGRLRIGATLSVCQYILPPIMREFRESFPHCDVSVVPGDTPEILEKMQERSIDLCFALEPVQNESLRFRPLFTDQLEFLVDPLHPWAQAKRVNRSEIGKQNYIFYKQGSLTFDLISRHFRDLNYGMHTYHEVGSMEAIKELVKLGLGISILAPWISQQEIEEAGSLVSLPLGRHKIQRRWGISSPKDRRFSLPEETFMGLCQSATISFRTGSRS